MLFLGGFYLRLYAGPEPIVNPGFENDFTQWSACGHTTQAFGPRRLYFTRYIPAARPAIIHHWDCKTEP